MSMTSSLLRVLEHVYVVSVCVCMYTKKRGNAVSVEHFVGQFIQLQLRKTLDQT